MVLLNNFWLCIIFGVLSIVLFAFYKYFKIARKNKNLKSNDDLNEKEKNDIDNKNYANLMALLSAISGLAAFITAIIPNISISGFVGDDSTTSIETTAGSTIVTSAESIVTDITAYSTETTNQPLKNTTNVKTTISSKELSTEGTRICDGEGIINDKKSL